MKIKVSSKDLTSLLVSASRFTTQKTQLPILSNLLLKTDKTRLNISATNLEMSLFGSIGAVIEEEGEIAVPSRPFSDLVANIQNQTIELFSTEESLKIKTEGFRGTLAGTNTADFPNIPQEMSQSNSLNIQTEDLISALSKVIFSVSTDEARPALTGVLVKTGPSGMSLVSSDGFRLSKVDLPKVKAKGKLDLLVPRGVLFEFGRFAKQEGSVRIAHKTDTNQLLFLLGRIVLSTRLIQGNFPAFEKIIPTSQETIVNVSKEDLSQALKLVSVYSRDVANTIRLVVEKEGVSVLAESTHAGKGRVEVPAKIEGEQITINFNYRFLEDFLGSVKGEGVVIKLGSATQPAVFTSPTESNYLHLIMPVKG